MKNIVFGKTNIRWEHGINGTSNTKQSKHTHQTGFNKFAPDYLHSLQSSISIETLLNLRRFNRVRIDINFVLIVATVGGAFCLWKQSQKFKIFYS